MCRKRPITVFEAVYTDDKPSVDADLVHLIKVCVCMLVRVRVRVRVHV